MGIELVKCGCGGEAYVSVNGFIEYHAVCSSCGMKTDWFRSKDRAITAWNRAMSGATDTNVGDKERTAKVEEAVPNMTILKRKVDLLSILQAIKSDKIRVWMNFDGKICFRNTKTGNEISVYPYYDMNGEKFDE